MINHLWKVMILITRAANSRFHRVFCGLSDSMLCHWTDGFRTPTLRECSHSSVFLFAWLCGQMEAQVFRNHFVIHSHLMRQLFLFWRPLKSHLMGPYCTWTQFCIEQVNKTCFFFSLHMKNQNTLSLTGTSDSYYPHFKRSYLDLFH